MTMVLIAFGVGFVVGVVATAFAAKKGWIEPSKVDPL